MSSLLRLLVPAVGLVAASLAAVPAHAQEGVLMKQMLGSLGILPEDKDPIEYRERPTLVVPKDTARLPPPEADAAKANPNWPKDPDVASREAARRQRSASTYIAPSSDPVNGARLSNEEMARHRTTRDSSGNNQVNTDKSGVRLSVQEMAIAGEIAKEPSYPPGTEPPRKYLTDPPSGARLPSAAAPMGTGRVEARDMDNGDRPKDTWKRLD
jgi:hypothetical protein